MADPALEARSLLWEWFGELDDGDPEQRAWKQEHCGGLVDAAEAVGILPPEEIDGWRRLLAGAELEPAQGDAAAATLRLEVLLAAVPPMSRDPRPEGLAAGTRFHAALGALRAAGVIGDDEEREWSARALAAEAPWLDDETRDELASTTGFSALAVPAASPEEEAADAALEAEFEAMTRRGAARRVFVPDRLARHDGLAVVAVIARTDSTEVVFHHVGGPQGDPGRIDAFRAQLDALPAPELADDAGTTYSPVRREPLSAHGTGGTPDPQRPRVTSGVWRYQPAAPETARAFTAGAGAARWRLVAGPGQ